ncbi:alpha-galactosidase [Sphingomonas sp.]|jgi:alpha-galactosidase|uniref:alpha-galactosidase n=1 Tax=Sphingomonas sp. TaxID=28214 RepID=UPI002DE391AB|nr:alpha-galactosidase [Sphingomonas sp.]
MPDPTFLRLDRGDTSLAFHLRDGGVELLYAGPSLPGHEDGDALIQARRRGHHESQPDRPVAPSLLPQAGTGYLGKPSVALMRGERLTVAGLSLLRVHRDQYGATFTFADAAAGVDVVLTWRIAASGLTVSSARLTNLGQEPLVVLGLASLTLPLPDWARTLVRYSGRWAGEMQAERLALPAGAVEMASRGGRPGFGGGQWVWLESTGATEEAGRVVAAHLAWSGDHETRIERDAEGEAVLSMAARLEPGEVVLQPGESFATPDALFRITDKGRAAASQAFHAQLPPSPGPRKVHLNSWEALGFDMDVPRLTALADDAAALGVERFVVDDGWFAGRADDRSGLGDWRPDPVRFPEGLQPIVDHVRARSMDFGLWVEPEMVSPDSDLYRAHPDWCLHVAGERPMQRHQLVLDMTRTDVTAHLFDVIDRLLSDHPIAYLKWDHNRDLFPLAGKGHAQTRGLYSLLDRLRAAHPGVEIETCASGGGRVDFAMLSRCQRYWASDNNDAIERLRINRGWFRFLPLRVTGNHVGPSPNPVTGRRLDMSFRAKVAMFGHMGVEAEPAAMSQQDRAHLAAHIALYKEWRPVLHEGRLSEIVCEAPGIFGWFAWRGDLGLALAAQTQFNRDFNARPVRLTGLDPRRQHRVRLTEPWPAKASRYLPAPDLWREGIVLTGTALAEIGLALPLTHPETAWLIAVEAL